MASFFHMLTNKPGCGGLAVARVDNMNVLWVILCIAGLGIGGIVVPASIITTIICPDVRHAQNPPLKQFAK